MDLSSFEYLVVGAGISGATVARRLVDRGKRVAVIEKASDIGGLCHSFVDKESGVECHSFGSHIFHTKDPQAIAFLFRFCQLNHYRHRVYSKLGQKVYPFPINLQTINQFFGLSFNPDGARRLLKVMACQNEFNLAEPQDRRRFVELSEPSNFEEACILQMGVPLYEAFIKGYSKKQWGVDLKTLPISLLSRIPVRFSYTSDYFDDPWQGIPIGGYHSLFSRLLTGIPAFLRVDFLKMDKRVGGNTIVVYTGPLDEYFDYRLGTLPWRSVGLEFEIVPSGDHQGCAVINYPSAVIPFTRVHEFKHLHPERKSSGRKTTIAREYPTRDGSPAYPVDPDGRQAQQYRVLASQEKRVFFCGRLGTYRYLNMDQAIVEAKALAERI